MRMVVDVLAVIGGITVIGAVAYAEGYVESMVRFWWKRRRS